MKCGLVKIALCTPEPVFGAPETNAERIKACVNTAENNGAKIAVFGRHALTGAVEGSMVHYRQLLDGTLNALLELVRYSTDKAIVLIVGLPMRIGSATIAVAALINCGTIAAIIPEKKVAVTSVSLFGKVYPLHFGTDIGIKNFDFLFSIAVGTDFDSVKMVKNETVGYAKLAFNITSSPALIGSFTTRAENLKAQSLQSLCAYMQVSIGGVSGETVYSGDKLAFVLGEAVALSEGDTEKIVYAAIDIGKINTARSSSKTAATKGFTPIPDQNKSPDSCDYHTLFAQSARLPFVPCEAEFDRIFDIMGRGIKNRMREAHARGVILGLSGGLDSTITLLTAAQMFKKYGLDLKNILCVTMPSENSSERTKKNAAELIAQLGVSGMEIPIRQAVDDHLANIGHIQKNDSVYENAQARERARILLDLANKHNALVLGTSDLSEIALGWSTYGGDQLAHYNPNSSLTKTLIRAMVCAYSKTTKNTKLCDALNDILLTPISPELLKNQETEKLLGPYELHDFFLYNLIGKGFTVSEVFNRAITIFPDKSKQDIIKYLRLFIVRFFNNQFKRNTACDGIHLSEFDLFGKVIPSGFSPETYLKDIERLEKAAAKK